MKTIVWDLDDVFNDLMRSWLELGWRVEHPESQARFEQLRSNPPLQELNTTGVEYLASLDRFRLSPAGKNLAPNPLLREWFERHGHQFHHHILTARPLSCVSAAETWVLNHFGAWIQHVHFVPSPRPGRNGTVRGATKAEALQRLGPVDFFVDDSIQNVRDASELGICSYLFPQPWNQAPFAVEEILQDLALSASKSVVAV